MKRRQLEIAASLLNIKAYAESVRVTKSFKASAPTASDSARCSQGWANLETHMAKIILGIGASHTPLLTLTGDQWQHRAAADYANTELNMSDGRLLTYEQLLAEVGPKYLDVVAPDILSRKEQICGDALDRLGDALAEAAPDVVVIVGDDQRELFNAANQPAVAIFHGDEIITSDKYGDEESADWVLAMGRGYRMDDAHVVPGASAFALELIKGLIEENFNIGALARVDDPKKAGVRPCLWLHRQATVQGSQYSRSTDGNPQGLRSIPRGALNSGSSEILNWVVTAGAVAALPLCWKECQALYRTPAGTGVGAAFAIWSAT